MAIDTRVDASVDTTNRDQFFDALYDAATALEKARTLANNELAEDLAREPIIRQLLADAHTEISSATNLALINLV
ncbi:MULTISPECIES: hypothetical protein [Mycobacteroides]|uniref:hypothetical protein n=1 Tax=Mycobacteroides TaxID=670516 RepID=UPI0008AA16DD|nr:MULTISPECIES: hypothetical protein [Mycobacteroides]OHT73408.1 hypothetical protein BKG66_08150 [Mycobacteroides chelonae]OHT75916.1 hypothetical protein BKG67_04745 [Mycobacteroides chelonae]SLC86638.1 Uncharacterised protein [Mycobacteroides abscessus subsp. abscessus]SLG75678.1 Uncharacterised protein [Mycobacteroides abscessus subsp. abscessus]